MRNQKIQLGIVVFILITLCSYLIAFWFYTTWKKIPNMNPEKTVQYFFEQFQRKRLWDMYRITYRKKPIFTADLWAVTYFQLESCEEVLPKSNISWPSYHLYVDFYDKTMVKVKFTIKFKNGFNASMADGTYVKDFYLVKETENSEWKIIEFGSG